MPSKRLFFNYHLFHYKNGKLNIDIFAIILNPKKFDASNVR